MGRIKEALPPVTIIVATYFPDTEQGRIRKQMASVAVKSWIRYLHYQGPLELHIADDGSELVDYKIFPYTDPMDGYDISQLNVHIPVSFSRQERKGVGASLNIALQQAFCKSPLAMIIYNDDVMLRETIDLTPWADLLLKNDDIGAVRLGLPHQGLTGEIVLYPQGYGLKLNKHNFAFTFRPTLFHKRFFDSYGWMLEGETALECERRYNLKFCESEGPDIIYALPIPWEHLWIMDLSDLKP